MKRLPDTEYILSLSYGKDSIACIEALYQLGYPLDRIIHAEVWATDDIPADLPPMVEFKKRADNIIKFRYGIEVEHICALDKDGSKLTYEKCFYKTYKSGKRKGEIRGFPAIHMNWCTSQLKTNVLNKISKGAYIGIAADEPERIERHRYTNKLPLVEIGWDENYCRKWCEDNSLLSPTYSDAFRNGCWFCHNQSVGQLRLLRQKYPDYWQLLLKWDLDSPMTFKPDRHTVHDFERRFWAEDNGIVYRECRFRWKQVLADCPNQITFYDIKGADR